MRLLPLTLLGLLLWALVAPTALARPAAPVALGEYLRGTVGLLEPGRAVVTLETGDIVDAELFSDGPKYRVGQAVVVWRTGGRYVLYDPVRFPWLGALLALFVAVVAVVGRGRGLRALLGTALSLLVLLLVVVPRLASGAPVVLTTLLAVLLVLAATLYLVHGVNRKTTAALLGTLAAAAFGFGLVVLAARLMAFTGAATTGATVAQASLGVDPLALYLVGVVVGALGALNDVTVTQASVVETLAHEAPDSSARDLYTRAMRVGADHIGGLVNVLVLAYAAGALPLLLLASRDPAPLWLQLNGEGLAGEIASVLVGATALVLAVPLTTWLAARAFHAAQTKAA